MALNEQLQEVIDRIGDTPLKERDLYKMLIAPDAKKSETIKAAFKRAGAKLSLADFTGMEIAEFYKALTEKVTSFKDADGTYKSTPATENCRFPDFEEAESINSAGVAFSAAQAGLQKAEDPEVLKEAIAKYKEALEALDATVWPISGIDKDALDEDEDIRTWEEQLVVNQILTSTIEIEKTSLGKL